VLQNPRGQLPWFPDVRNLRLQLSPTIVEPTGKHANAIRDMPAPIDHSLGLVNKTQLRSFTGLVKYARRYIKNCGTLPDPLINQLPKDESDGIWRPRHELAFVVTLKHAIAFTKGVHHINCKLPIFVCTNGSKRGIGGYMYQKVEGEERVVSYFSRATRKEERKWGTGELEVLALIATLEHFHHFVEGQRLLLETDHKNITWLGSMKNFSGRLGRWVLRLSEYNAQISYRKGSYLFVADCLSRNSVKQPESAGVRQTRSQVGCHGVSMDRARSMQQRGLPRQLTRLRSLGLALRRAQRLR